MHSAKFVPDHHLIVVVLLAADFHAALRVVGVLLAALARRQFV